MRRPTVRNKTFLIAALALAGFASQTIAGTRRERPVLVDPMPLQADGCYYYRERRYCGRYCYYEVNGRRYCQPREREASPQAGYEYDLTGQDYGLK